MAVDDGGFKCASMTNYATRQHNRTGLAELRRKPKPVAVLDEKPVAILNNAVATCQPGGELHANRHITYVVGAHCNYLPIAAFLIGTGTAIFQCASICNRDSLAS